MGQRNFKETFEFHNLSEIFCCGMIRLRNTNLGDLYNVNTQEPFYKKRKYGTESVSEIIKIPKIR